MKVMIILIIILAISLVFLAYENRPKTDFVEEDYMKPMERPIGGETSQPLQLTLNLSSDKEIYHSSEEMELTTAIEVSTKAENLTVKVYGIKDRSGNYRVKGEKVVDVDPPRGNETFAFQMPSCYGCAGVSPGEYEIIFEVLQNGEIIGNCSKIVKLEK
ncbi:MAG: hypothetical protein V3U72_05040 [Candidatus Aenigmarchaeota archaeon]